MELAKQAALNIDSELKNLIQSLKDGEVYIQMPKEPKEIWNLREKVLKSA